MYVPAILPTQISKFRPTKRKIVNTVATTEKVSRSVKPDLPVELQGLAQLIADNCNKAKKFMTKAN